MDYNSKYTGEQVEELLDKINASPEDVATPSGNYPDMTVGKASQADTAARAINADNATKAASATTADRATQATTADKATTADYATTAGQATTAESAKTATNADRATTAGHATTAGVAESAEHATTAESTTHADTATKADFATDLSGRNEVTAEEFTLRPSAGNISIRDDSATIKRIKGNSVVWNQVAQFRDSGEENGLTFTKENGILRVSGTVTEAFSYDTCRLTQYLPQGLKRDGRKYLISINAPDGIAYGINGYPVSNTKPHFWSAEADSVFYGYISIKIPVGTTVDYVFSNPQIIDLTQMFGAGNEPTTVEEFRALFPDNYYEYNPGQLVSMTANGLFTNGFNQWDEQWEVGQISSTNGNVVSGGNKTISKNYIPVLPNTSYYLTLPLPQDDSHGVYYYDGNKNYIGFQWIARDVNQNLFTTPSNCLFIKFDSWGTTYNNDICINLSHTGVENGKYEPYWDATKDLSIIQKYFPNGMRSAGSIYDEISFDETTQKWVAIQRVGNVDLGSLSWSQNPSYGFYVSIGELSGMQNVTDNNINANILCTKYTTGRAGDIFTQVKTNSIAVSTTHLVVGDLTYNTANDFKTAMSGVILNYELAEPIITVIEEPVDLSYKVGDFGIEQILSDSFSAPFRADIVYQFNATDRIRENSLNIEKLSKTQNEYLPLAGGTMSGQINSQDIKPVEDSTYQLGDSTHKYDNVFSNFFTGNLEGNAKTATVATDLSGRVEATPEVFTYRPSAGEKSIKDDNAFIRRVKGNSVVFNQLVKNGDFASVENWVSNDKASTTLTIEGGKAVVTSKYAGTGLDAVAIRQTLPTSVANHKYFVSLDFSTNNTALTPHFEYYRAFSGFASSMFRDGNTYSSIFIAKESGATNFLLKPQGTKAVGDVWEWDNVMIIDLTAMFGTGNEPTVEEFRALYPDSYYPYNAGELRNLDCSGIKTVGFNLFDEDIMTSWSGITKDNRGWYGNTKSFYQDSSNNRNKLWVNTMGYTGQICVYIKSTAVDTQTNFRPQIYYTDGTSNPYDDRVTLSAKKTSVEGYIVSDENKVVESVEFSYGNDGYVIVNNLCINLHHTGWRDGEYEPYKEITHSLPLSQITNGEPLRKAGSVYDEINETEYIRRVGIVDLGSLNWWLSDSNKSLFAVDFFHIWQDNSKAANILCAKYVTLDYSSVYMESTGIAVNFYDGNCYLAICDKSFTDAASLKASLSGVLLHYELAEPIVTPIETPIDFNYYVEDFGTEEALLTEDSAPFSADIVYQFNATDQIRNNSRNIDKLQKSAFTPRGTSSQYIRGDGSYGDIVELSQSTPINNGEFEITDEGDRQFILTPNYYAKSQVTLDNTTTIAVFVTAPEDSHYLAEYWFEFAADDTLPNIEYYQPNNSKAVFRIDGDMMTGAVNILHLISSDGGNTFFGEIRSYSL